MNAIKPIDETELERAARGYCLLMGLDPEEQTGDRPRWVTLMPHVRQVWALMEAIVQARTPEREQRRDINGVSG